MNLDLITRGQQTCTILDFVVDDIDEAVDELLKRGVQFENQENLSISQDEKAILRGRSHKQVGA